MKTDTKAIPMTVRSITFGALTIALIVVFFTFFKGVTNILNAFFVPMILFSFSINRNTLELLAVFVAANRNERSFFQLAAGVYSFLLHHCTHTFDSEPKKYKTLFCRR